MKSGKEINDQRNYYVAKSNDHIQKARYNLSTLELKTLSFMISLIKPEDKTGKFYTFSITDYCHVRGINPNDANVRNLVKNTIKALHDKSFWIIDPNGQDVLCSWIDKVKIDRGGYISIRFDEDIESYLFGLIDKKRYTQYELLYTLPMKSGYSIRLYEVLKSCIDLKNSKSPNKFRTIKEEFNMDELRQRVGSNKIDEKSGKVIEKHYPQFREFKRNVLDVAVKEINDYTDLNISYVKLCKGRMVTGIQFKIAYKNSDDLLKANQKVEDAINKVTAPRKKREETRPSIGDASSLSEASQRRIRKAELAGRKARGEKLTPEEEEELSQLREEQENR